MSRNLTSAESFTAPPPNIQLKGYRTNDSARFGCDNSGVDASAFNNFAFHDNEAINDCTESFHNDNTESDGGVQTNSVIICELPVHDNDAFHVSSDDLTSRGNKVNSEKDAEKGSSTSQHTCCSSRCIVATVVTVVCATIAIGVGLGVGLGLGLQENTTPTPTELIFSRLSIQLPFDPAYDDVSAPATVNLTTRICSAMNATVGSISIYNSTLSALLHDCTPVNYSSGSTVVGLTLLYQFNGNDPNVLLVLVADTLNADIDSPSSIIEQIIGAAVTVQEITCLHVLCTRITTVTTSNSPPTTQGSIIPQCVNLTSMTCAALDYNSTGFPNIFGHSDISLADDALSVILSLESRDCYNGTLQFACASSYPECTSQGRLLFPCRDFCYDFRQRCNFPLICESFPDDNDPSVCVLTPLEYRPVYQPPTPPNASCVGSTFLCGNDKCIDTTLVCNNVDDCGDYSDETSCSMRSSLDCTFEAGSSCGYVPDSMTGYRWTVVQGTTVQDGTRPFYDHTKRSRHGQYAVASASGSMYLASATLSSTIVDFSRKHCFRFYYYMNGSDVNTLQVKIFSKQYSRPRVVWQRFKSQGDTWRFGYVELPSVVDSLSPSDAPVGQYYVVFRSVRGEGYRGDIAVDDISARPGSCPPQACDMDQYSCVGGWSCILQRFVCDGNNDCGDFSDETNCTCALQEFQCKSGMCVAGYRQCDGKTDCPDGSDEIDCVCPLGQYKCPDDGPCIMSEWLCDRQKDCPDGADETHCGSCDAGSFQCNDYSCVPLTAQCNGLYDCEDASDELNCIRQLSDNNIIELFATNNTWLPVCSVALPDEACNQLCQLLGMSSFVTRNTMELYSSRYFTYTPTLGVRSSNTSVMANFSTVVSCVNSSVLYLRCQPSVCGRPTLDTAITPYIVHGTDAPQGRWPWQVAILRDGSVLCGGSLVDNYHVVTAAHCMEDDVPLSSYTILLGSNVRTGGDEHRITRNVKLTVNHEKYQRYYWGYDISMLTLSDSVTFSEYIIPICLQTPSVIIPRSSVCYSTGWGLTDYNRSTSVPVILQQGKMKLWSLKECQTSYSYATSLMQCAGYMSGYIANCPGDSGGPLACWTDNKYWSLVGVFSFLTSGCNVPMKPSVFTSVQQMYNWIIDKTECKFKCNNTRCVWDLSELCNGVDNCGDMSDEIRPCNASISCSFEDSYLCGYQHVTSPGQLTQWRVMVGAAGNNEGPIVDTTYGNSTGRYLYARDGQSTLLSPVYDAQSPHCLQIRHSMRYQDAGKFVVFTQMITNFNISVKMIPLANIEVLLDINGNQEDLWYTDRIDLKAGTYVIGFNATAKLSVPSAAVAIDDVALLDGSCSAQVCRVDEFTCDNADTVFCVPMSQRCNYFINCIDISDELDCTEMLTYTCDFEKYGDCGWEQDSKDTRDWLLQASGRMSNNNGPATDHTTNTSRGFYGYFNSLDVNVGDVTRLSLSISNSANTPSCFIFYYNMISNGRLTVYYERYRSQSQSVWTVNERNTSRDWERVHLHLPTAVNIIKFEAVAGIESSTKSVSYIAIDDVSIIGKACTENACLNNQFRCQSGHCIMSDEYCDGHHDCADGSDEAIGCNRSAVVVSLKSVTAPGTSMIPISPQPRSNSPTSRAPMSTLNRGIPTSISSSVPAARGTTSSISNIVTTLPAIGSDYSSVANSGSITSSTMSSSLVAVSSTRSSTRNTTSRASSSISSISSMFTTVSSSISDTLSSKVNTTLRLATSVASGNTISTGSTSSLSWVSSSHSLSTQSTTQNVNYKTSQRTPSYSMVTGFQPTTTSSSTKSCDVDQWRCSNGQCVNTSQRCDLIHGCANSTDQASCSLLSCSDGSVISSSNRCNGLPNCPYAEDELNCFCAPGRYQCNAGLCIHKSRVCDGNFNCPDLSDERNCPCNTSSTLFRCPNGLCARKCNNINECGDNSDERGCATCPADEFTCTNGNCIYLEFRCDGQDDCGDDSDERLCVCQEDEFKCTDGKCLQVNWVCDGHADCTDGKDEFNCSKCTSLQFTCKDYSCLSMSLRCNGVDDCPDGGDEKQCVNHKAFLSAYFKSVYYPVCAATWSVDWSSGVCSALGLGSPVSMTTVIYNSPQYLQVVNTSVYNVSMLRLTSSCPGQRVVRVACMDAVCGTSAGTAPYIVGGELAAANTWPWAATLLYRVRLSAIRRTGFDRQLQVFSVKRVVLHPSFTSDSNGSPLFDIALVQLGDILLAPTEQTLLTPVCLPNRDIDTTTLQTVQCYAIGWGLSNPLAGSAVIDLRQAKMKIWTHSQCSLSTYWGRSIRRDVQLCAGYTNGYISMCSGDSGGPLMCKDASSLWILRGIVSFGTDPCAGSDLRSVKPTVFSNVFYFANWTQSMMQLYT